jgi:transcriptional regulator GlxA family with amidase domain
MENITTNAKDLGIRPSTTRSGVQAVEFKGFDSARPPAAERAKDRMARLMEAKAEIERTATAPLYVAHYAEVARLSPVTFTRHFVRCFGVTPVRYRLQLRVAEACRLLVDFPRINVAMIARQAGFEDVRFFRRAFREIRGVGPSEYRRLFGKSIVPPAAAEPDVADVA